MDQYIPGVEYDFGGGRVKVVAPLPLGAIMRLQSKLEKLSTAAALAPESMVTIMQATHASLKRNYPDISEEEVGELVDVGNMLEVIEIIMDVGGFKRKAAEAAAKNRQAQTGSQTDQPAGQPS